MRIQPNELAELAAQAERKRIAGRIRQIEILRLQPGIDPLEQINEILQQLADDIATDWADYEEP